jgi:hypothetical protein
MAWEAWGPMCSDYWGPTHLLAFQKNGSTSAMRINVNKIGIVFIEDLADIQILAQNVVFV